jgi:hypothetical protein
LQACFDVNVRGVELGSALISVQGVIDLVVAGLILARSVGWHGECGWTYQGAQVIPDLGDVGIEANGSGIRIERVAVLINLVVENAYGAPEGGVTTIAIDGLLIGFVGFGILLLRHVAATEQIPALCILVVWEVSGEGVEVPSDLPELTDFSRYSMACSWLLKLLLCWW